MSSQPYVPERRITRGSATEQQAQDAIQRIHQEIESSHRETALLLGSGLSTMRDRSQHDPEESSRKLYTVALQFELNRVQTALLSLREKDPDQFSDLLKHLFDIDQATNRALATPDDLEDDIFSEELPMERWIDVLASRIEYIESTKVETLEKIEEVKQQFIQDLPIIAEDLGVNLDVELLQRRIEQCKIVIVDPLVAKLKDYGGYYDPEERVVGISYMHALDPESIKDVVVHELFHVISGQTETLTQEANTEQKDVVRSNRIGLAFSKNEDVVMPDKTYTMRAHDRFKWLNEGITELLTEWYLRKKDFLRVDAKVYLPERKMVGWVLKEAGISEHEIFSAYFEPGDMQDEVRAKALRLVFAKLRERYGEGTMVKVDEVILQEDIGDPNKMRFMQLLANLPGQYMDKLEYFYDIQTDIISSATGEGITNEIASALLLKNVPEVRLSGFTKSIQAAIEHAQVLAEQKSPEFIDGIDDLLESVAKLKPAYKVGKRWEIDEAAFEELAGVLESLVVLQPYFTPAQRQREAQVLKTNGVAKLMREAQNNTDLRDAVAYYIGNDRIMLEYATAQLPDDSALKQMCDQVQRFVVAKTQEYKTI